MTLHFLRHSDRFEMATDFVTEQRTVIKFYVKLKKTLQETNVDLRKVYGNSTLNIHLSENGL